MTNQLFTKSIRDKKTYAIAFALFGIFATAFFLTAGNTSQEVRSRAAGNSLVVAKDGSGQYTTIQTGLDAANAGDTVTVKPGTYNETVTFKKSGTSGNYITLQGQLGAIIDGTGSTARGLITFDGRSFIIINGMTVKNAPGHGMYGGGGINNIVIQDNEVDTSKDGGIFVGDGSNITITGNKVHGTNSGASGGSTAILPTAIPTKAATAQPTTSIPSTGTTTGNAPADPGANATVKNLLSNMYKYKGKFLLSGQMDSDTGGDQQAALAARNGGVYAAIHGYDWAVGGVTAGNAATYLNKMIAEWNQYKIIPTVSQHWTPNSATETQPGCGNLSAKVSMTDLMNPSTTVGARYAAWKKNVGDDFKTLSDAGVPVLFRPYHEAGNSCFWWNENTPADYVTIWKDTFNYITNTRGLHNVLWVFNSNGPNVNKSYYPGDSYVDIIGGDNYTVTNGDFSGDYKFYQGFSANKLVALPEVSSVPELSKFSSYPVVFEMTWSGSYLAQSNTDAQLKTFFANPMVVNRSTVSKFIGGSL